MQLKIDEANNQYFYSCTGKYLTEKQKEELGLDGLKYKQSLRDARNNFIGVVFFSSKYGNMVAYNADGIMYVNSTYNEISSAKHCIETTDSFNKKLSGAVYNFMHIGRPLYDIYFYDKLIYREATRPAIIIEDFYTHEDRYIGIQDGRYTYIYDTVTSQIICHIDECICALNKHCAIHSEFERIIVNELHQKDDNIYDTANIYDFQGEKLATLSHYGHLSFTEIKDYYRKYDKKTDKYGIHIFRDNKLKEAVPAKQHKIFQVFEDKIVVKSYRKYVKIFYLQYKLDKKTNEMVWKIKNDNYNFPASVEEAFFLEDESEAILTIYGKKILLSYFTGYVVDDMKYECDEIVYKGNEVFKCFQFQDDFFADVTHIYQHSAVSYTELNEPQIHIKNPESYIHVFSDDGRTAFKKEAFPYSKKISDQYEITTLRSLRNSLEHNDFMTIRKQHEGNVIIVYDYVDGEVRIINGLTGEDITSKEGTDYYMLWHNLYVVNDKFCHVSEISARQASILYSDKFKYHAGFNDYIVTSHGNDVYISSKDNFSLKMANSHVTVDKERQICICSDSAHIAYVVSNDGYEEFTHIDIIENLDVYRSTTREYYIVGENLVSGNSLKKECIIYPSFSKLF